MEDQKCHAKNFRCFSLVIQKLLKWGIKIWGDWKEHSDSNMKTGLASRRLELRDFYITSGDIWAEKGGDSRNGEKKPT